MKTQLVSHSEGSTSHASPSGRNISSDSDGVVGAVHFAKGGGDAPPVTGHAVHATDHAMANGEHSADNTDHFVGNVHYTADNQAVSGGLLTIDGIIENPAKAGGDVHSIDHSTMAVSSGADFIDVLGTSNGLVIDTHYTIYDDSLHNTHI